MTSWFLQLDQILRGEKTRPNEIRDATLSINAPGLSLVIILLGITYGFFMGSFALARGIESGDNAILQSGILQTLASMVKIPLLFFCTLGITFPSLYVFNALVGSRLKIGSVFRLLIAALAVNLAVLASMGPIVAFFSVSTPNYTFVLLLNVLVCAVAGFLGLAFLLQTLHRMTKDTRTDPEPVEINEHGEAEPNTTQFNKKLQGPLVRDTTHVLGGHIKSVFAIWVIVFGLVGAQMSWVLRPFIGHPDLPFQWLRVRDSNFFEAVGKALYNFF